jgi:ribosomal protein L7/L12
VSTINLESVMPKQKVSIDEVRRLLKRKREINAIPFKDLVWVHDDGSPAKVSKDLTEAFEMMGLVNIDFVGIMDGDTRVSVMKFSKKAPKPLSKRAEKEIREAVKDYQKIKAVKMYREATSSGLYDAKKYVDKLADEYYDVTDTVKARPR